MLVNHSSPQLFIREPIHPQKNEKTKIVARDVFASLPTLGFDPISLCVGISLGWGIANAAHAIRIFLSQEKEEDSKPSQDKLLNSKK